MSYACTLAQDVRRPISAAESIDDSVTGKRSNVYSIGAAAGDFFRVLIRPNGSPLAVNVNSPSGSTLNAASNDAGQPRTMSLSAIASEPGIYSVQLRLTDAAAPIRTYTITLAELRPSRPEDATRIRAEQAQATARKLQEEGSREALNQAIAKFGEAITLWHALDDKLEEGRSLDANGDTYLSLGEKAKASECFDRALPLASSANDDDGRASVISNLGVVAAYSGKLAKALAYYQQSLELSRRAGDKDLQAITQSNIGSVYMTQGDAPKALECATRAAALAAEAGDRKTELTALANAGAVYARLGQSRRGLASLEQTLPLWHEMHDARGEAQTLRNMAGAYAQLGEPDKAVEAYRKLMPLSIAAGDKRGQAMTLANLGIAEMELSDPRAALADMQQALPIAREIGDTHLEESVLSDVARAYLYIGEFERALDYNAQALKIQHRIGDKRGEAAALDNLGVAFAYMGESEKALNTWRQALALAREVSDRSIESDLLNSISGVYLDRQDAAAALPNCEQALALSRDTGSRQQEALALLNIGSAYLGMGNLRDAEQNLQQASEQLEAVGDKLHLARALYARAILASRDGDWAAALRQLDRALRIDESLRAEMIGAELRASYFATVLAQYKLRTDVLMHLNRLHPGQGYEVQGFESSEQARARSLLDLLSASADPIHEGVDLDLLRRERILRARLRAQGQRQIGSAGKKDPVEDAAREAEIRSLTTQYQELEARIVAQSPRYAAFVNPQPLTLAELRRSYLDGNTLLLEYSLGDERSFVWAITQSTIHSYELPRRAELEQLARQAYAQLSGSGGVQPDSSLADLSRVVLSPVAALLGSRRLLVVTEGALEYIPFAALPAPGQPHTPLIVAHEVVTLPSASTIAFIRHGSEYGARPQGTLAVIADPVFSADDPRVASLRPAVVATPGEAERGAAQTSAGSFERLPYTRREAEGIMALVEASKRFSALDFDASVRTATSGTLSRYRFVHLASHGVLNSTHPELSGIVLSMVDHAGHPQDGILETTDIYNLRLHADLVVLSACRTALGAEVRGEGLVGLTRAFLYAGTPRVVASLWTVPDLSTAELMGRFYRFMLVNGLRPSDALRRAQLSMWSEGRWARPYYWAAFTLEGEWR